MQCLYEVIVECKVDAIGMLTMVLGEMLPY